MSVTFAFSVIAGELDKKVHSLGSSNSTDSLSQTNINSSGVKTFDFSLWELTIPRII